MKKLFRKTYDLEIIIPRKLLKDKKILFRYKQGTLEQILQLSRWLNDDYNINEYVSYFLNNICYKGKISKRDFKKIKLDHMTKIFSFILETFGKGYFAKKSTNKKTNAPTSSFIVSVCNQLKMSPLDFLQLTWEQIEYLSDGIIWNNNETTKEGRKRNIRNSMKKELEKTDIAKSLKEIERIDKKINNLK